MANKNRALRRDFIEFMNLSDYSWPKDAIFTPWIRKQYGGIGTAVYGQMKQGIPVPAKCAVGLCKYFLACRERGEQREFCKAFAEFLRIVGIVNPESCSDIELAKVLCDVTHRDGLEQGIDGVIAILKQVGQPESMAMLCQKPSHVEDAVRWLYISGGRQLNGGHPDLPVEIAIKKSEKHLATPLDQFQRSAVVWHQYHPWTVIHSRGIKVPNGMSIVLPLRPDVYNKVRSGEHFVPSVLPSDMQFPSNHLFVHSCFPRPSEDIAGNEGDWNISSVAALMTQLAVLTSCHEQERQDDEIALLSVGCIPQNRVRLESHRFKSIGILTMVERFELFERVLGTSLDHGDSENYYFRGLLAILAIRAHKRFSQENE